MKNKHNNSEAFFERMRELAAVNKQIIKESKTSSTLLDHKKASDGRVYGIVKENQSYFIKTAQSKQNLSEADFAYIGGLANITEYKCSSLTEAQRVLNTKLMAINETYGDVMEDEQEDAEQQQAPSPEPQPEPMPEPEEQPQPEASPESEQQPSPEPMPEPQSEPEMSSEKDEIHSSISKAAGLFSDAQLEPSKVEYYLKQFLGVIKDSQISKLGDEEKQGIYDEYFMNKPVEEQYPINEDMDQETIEMIVAGIGALGMVGLGFAIEPLKKMLSKTSVGKKIVSGLEKAGSAAGDATRSGMSKGKYNESEEFLKEEDIYEDDELESADDEMDMDIDTPEIDTVDTMDSMPVVDTMDDGNKEVNIDLKSGTVNVKLSEAKIKDLSKKYNVSESYIKWKMEDILTEEVEKVEKEKLKEEKVRKVVRNIIKEKLGLKKKPLNESVNKERVKLEKLVESVLKKNM